MRLAPVILVYATGDGDDYHEAVPLTTGYTYLHAGGRILTQDVTFWNPEAR